MSNRGERSSGDRKRRKMVRSTVSSSPGKEIVAPAAATKDNEEVTGGSINACDSKSQPQVNSGDVAKQVDLSLSIEGGAMSPKTEVPVTRPQPTSPNIPSPDALVCIKVKDFLGVVKNGEAQQFVLPQHTSFGRFFQEVSSRFEINLGDFDVTYQDKMFSYNLSGFTEMDTFTAINVVPNPDKVYVMSLDVSNTRKRKRVVDAGVTTDASDYSILSGLDQITIKKDYVGLKNKNMTCYLNSFLQWLWYTPEFRNAIYVYVYDVKRCHRKSLCVPLQKMFLQMQLSIRESIDTDELTNAFGWEDRDSWNQHDIEELSSTFMDNLTREFYGTPLDKMLQTLYFGTYTDYIQCLECNYTSPKDAIFLALPLTIHENGKPFDVPTLGTALGLFSVPEIMDGNNKYNCPGCNKQVAAKKGLKLKNIPYIFSIQLKRFDFNYMTGNRQKLNNKIEFPFILDMNPYVESPKINEDESAKIDLIRPKSVSEGRVGHSRPYIVETTELDDEEEVAPPLADTEVMSDMVQLNGPLIYQLYGVFVHKGGINSGHYYAFMLDFERNLWLKCDDSSVRKATVDDVKATYGGYFDDEREPSVAYMLIYRRFDPELNLLPYYQHEMPEHIQAMWKEQIEIDKQLHEQEELAKNTILMNCYVRDGITQELFDKVVQIPKTMSVADVAVLISQAFADLFPIYEGCTSDHLHLSRFDKDLGIIESSFDGLDEENIVMALREKAAITKNEGLFLEKKKDDKPFQSYSTDDIIFKTHLVDRQEVSTPHEIHVKPDETVEGLKKMIINNLELGIDEVELIVVGQHLGQFTTLTGDKHPISLYQFQRINDIYVEPGCEAELGDKLLIFIEKYTTADIIQVFMKIPSKAEEESLALELESLQLAKLGVENVKADVAESPQEASKNIEAQSEAEISQMNATPGVEQRPKAKEHLIQLVSHTMSTEDNIMVYTIRIESQTPLYSLSEYLSALVSVPETHFVLYKVDRMEQTELRRLTERLHGIKPFDNLFIKMEQRLKDGETRIPIFKLNGGIGCLERPYEFLADLILTQDMTAEDVKKAVVKKGKTVSPELDTDLSRLRIRKMIRNNPSRIMREKMKVKDLFNINSFLLGELIVQIMPEPDVLPDKTFAMMYRHWHSSLGSLDPPVEILIFHDYSEDLEDIMLRKIRESMQVGDDVELVVSKVDNNATFPFNISNRLLADLTWFELVVPAKKSLYVYSDELILYVKDKNETILEDLNESRQTITPIESLVAGPPSPRRETGVKLNLAPNEK